MNEIIKDFCSFTPKTVEEIGKQRKSNEAVEHAAIAFAKEANFRKFGAVESACLITALLIEIGVLDESRPDDVVNVLVMLTKWGGNASAVGKLLGITGSEATEAPDIKKYC